MRKKKETSDVNIFERTKGTVRLVCAGGWALAPAPYVAVSSLVRESVQVRSRDDFPIIVLSVHVPTLEATIAWNDSSGMRGVGGGGLCSCVIEFSQSHVVGIEHWR